MAPKKDWPREKARAVTDEERKHSVFVELRKGRANQRLKGYREKKAREAAEEATGIGGKIKK